MKIKKLAIVCMLSTAFISCDNDDKKTETMVESSSLSTPGDTIVTQTSQEGSPVLVMSDKVPEPVRNSFSSKYPKVQKTEWYSYKPVESDGFQMDQEYFYVRYNDNGADYTSWYNNKGEWVKTSTRVEVNSKLPDPVNQHINVNYPGYTIEEIEKGNDKDAEIYELKLKKDDSKVKLKILANGEVYKRKSS